MRHRVAALLLLLLLPALSGCWNKIEAEEAAFALALGIDKGTGDLYRITMLIARPDKLAGKEGGGGGGGGGKGEGDKPYLLVTTEAPTLTGAIALMDSFAGRNVTLHQVRALFMSEELARSSGLKSIDEILRFSQTRRTIFYVVTREPAAAFLKAMEPKLEKNPMRYFEQMTYNYRLTGMLPNESQVNSFVSRVDVGFIQPLTYYAAVEEGEGKGDKTPPAVPGSQSEAQYKAGELPRKGGTNVDMIGGAAFRGDKMVGVLTGAQMRYVLLLQDRFRRAYATFRDPRDPSAYVGVELRRGRPAQINVDLSGQRPKVRATVTLEAELLAIQSGVDYTEPALQRELEQAIAQQMTGPMQELIRQTQDWQTDIVGFGRHAVNQFATVEAWQKYNWPARFPQADVTVDLKVKLRRFGLTLSPIGGSK